MSRRYIFMGSVVLALFVSACSAVRVEDEREMRAAPVSPPAVVYVKDFDPQTVNFWAETGILPVAPLAIGGPAALIPRALAGC